MTRTKLLLVLAFLLVCAAGVAVGTLVDHRVFPPPVPDHQQPPEFRDLKLTSEQHEAMRRIWGDFGKQRGQLFQNRHQLDQQQEESIRQLFTPEQLQKYEQIQQNFEQQRREAEDQVQKLYKESEEKTRAMLTPEQQKQWDEMRQRMRHGGRGPGKGSPGMGPPMGPPGMGGPGMGGPGFPRHEHRHSSTWPSSRPTGAPTTEPAALNPEP